MKNTEFILRNLREKSGPLDIDCPYALQNFFSGFQTVDLNIVGLWRFVNDQQTAIDNLGLASKVCFATCNRHEAYELLLTLLIDASGDYEGEVEIVPFRPFIESIREIIVSGRTGMIFLSPDHTSLFQFWMGYAAGLDMHYPEMAEIERLKIRAFEKHLCKEEGLDVKWFIYLRTHYKNDLVHGFLDNWDKFQKNL